MLGQNFIVPSKGYSWKLILIIVLLFSNKTSWKWYTEVFHPQQTGFAVRNRITREDLITSSQLCDNTLHCNNTLILRKICLDYKIVLLIWPSLQLPAVLRENSVATFIRDYLTNYYLLYVGRLGCEHDAPDESGCEAIALDGGSTVMNPTAGGNQTTSWSPCSRAFITGLFECVSAKCK